MPVYIALIREDEDDGFTVSFPDVEGVFTAGDSIEEAIEQAQDLLEFAAESWLEDTGRPFPSPRTLAELQAHAAFMATVGDGQLVPVSFEDAALGNAKH
ncbi:MAG: type II toxin-antitoxin system HicB family antitoxin [Bosea sp. (in: a-proteobacteria)]